MARVPPVFVHIRIGLLAISILQVFWLIYHGVLVENRRGGTVFKRLKKSATAFNILLLILVLSNITMLVAVIIRVLAATREDYLLSLILLTVSAASMNHSYICCTWNRGSKLAEIVSPRTFPYARAIVAYGPFTFYATPIATIVQIAVPTFDSSRVSQVLYILSACLTILFDAYIVLMYSRYLHQLSQWHPNQRDEHLNIISRYGIASSIAGVMCLVGFIGHVVYGDQLEGQIFSLFAQMFGFLMHSALLLMKRMLVRQKNKEETERRLASKAAKVSNSRMSDQAATMLPIK
ncbi:hypothetical protein BJ741DRAFT_668673 [Chytriomyces cf. hyalinus JEL632]|nr:hypothetical protein BJ741DRAFT_668673 [Chytriomyces cf. hyalinus JEL632]